MADYRLWCFAESGNAYKAAFMLNACGLEWEPVVVDFFNGETRSPAYRADVNELGEVPVLAHDGRKLSQSGLILRYIAERTGQFLPANDEERYEAMRWLFFDNHKFTSYIATLRFMVALARTGETPVTEFLRQRAEGAIAIVEKHLGENEWMVGQRPTIVDFSFCGYLFHPEEYGIDWRLRPHIRAWLARLQEIPGWKPPYEMMPRAPQKRA